MAYITLIACQLSLEGSITHHFVLQIGLPTVTPARRHPL